MNKINSFDELKLLVDKFKSSLYMRENYTKEKITKREILVCGGTGCTSSSSKEIINNLTESINVIQDVKEDVEEIKSRIIGGER